MKQNILETIVGFSVIITAILFALFTYNINTADQSGSDCYSLRAKFQNVEGVTSGSDIMISGVKIGSVESIELDKNSFDAVALLKINSNIRLSKDSQASILTSGLLGGKYIAISPGGEDEYLQHNDQLKYTQSAINIEALIGKIIYSISNK